MMAIAAASTAEQVFWDVWQGEDERVRITLSFKDREVLFERMDSNGQADMLKRQVIIILSVRW